LLKKGSLLFSETNYSKPLKDICSYSGNPIFSQSHKYIPCDFISLGTGLTSVSLKELNCISYATFTYSTIPPLEYVENPEASTAMEKVKGLLTTI